MVEKNRIRKRILKAAKIAIGSSMAIFIAKMLHLDHMISAGTIALLTMMTTKWETVKLSVSRLVTMLIAVTLAGILFQNINNEWQAYGLFVFLMVVISEMLGWGATISVNAVIGAHFLTNMDFGRQAVMNEVLLVVIGTALAVILNLFQDYGGSRKNLMQYMRVTEEWLQKVLKEIAEYMSSESMRGDVWVDIGRLEGQLKEYIIEACEYQENTFSSHSGYYIDYFEMRLQQCIILHNLHYEVKKIRSMPAQAGVIADYMLYLKDYVVEKNIPEKQMERLMDIFRDMKKEPLPQSREEFESRAILYHILMDLEDFLICKRRFVESLDEKQKKIYWNTNV